MNGRAVLAWVAGVPLTLLGLLLLIGAPPVGIVVVLVGLYVLPPVNRRVEIDIAPSWAAAWIGGTVLLLSGLVVAQRVPVAGAPAIVGGLFALPPVRRQVTARTGLALRRGVVIGVVVLAAAGAGTAAGLAMANNETLGQEAVVHEVGERFTVDVDDSELALTVEDVDQTNSLERPGGPGPADEAYLVLRLRIEVVGDKHVSFQNSNFVAVGTGGEEHMMTVDTNAIRDAEPYRAPGLDLSPTSSGPTLDAGANVTRTVAFEVDRGETYLFRNGMTGQYSGADRHYVPLGEV
jgi:hypothetical protein